MQWIVLGVIFLIIVWVVSIYNGLVRLRVESDTAWADIDVQLKRRWDLVPNLVETVKGYASHERETFEAVTNARSQAMNAQGPAEKAQAEGMLTQALKSLFAVAEAYPQLRAVEGFTSLQNSLSQLEDAIQNARRYYNAVVRDLNTRIAQFPSSIIAGSFGFKPRQFFEMPETEKAVPRVDFGSTPPTQPGS
jgi:LemA protein